jgi:hypothetical protein
MEKNVLWAESAREVKTGLFRIRTKERLVTYYNGGGNVLLRCQLPRLDHRWIRGRCHHHTFNG